MATKSPKPEAVETLAENTQVPELIETLRAKHKIGRAVYAGACAANGWRPGRAMTEKEFLSGIAVFTGTPMHGTRRKESEGK